MVIVSMMTESYSDWAFHFINGLKGNTNEKILINLINFSEEKINILKETFKDVIFENTEVKLILRENYNFENKVFKVTYLKGRFISEAIEKYREPVLWIDITALIRKDLGEVFSKLRNTEALLIRRNFEKDFGKSVYAAEIFGINSREVAEKYYRICEERKREWFSDQLALCSIDGKKDFIEFGKWCNFYYDPEAYSWSDRGKTGNGKIEADDDEYSKNKFIEDLSLKIENYVEKFYDYKRKIMKPKILIFTDDRNWCYSNTAKAVAKNKDFEFTIINDLDRDRDKLMEWKGDLVWGRCGSFRHKKIYDLRPELRKMSFSTITTGGDCLINRFEKQIGSNKNEAGVIVQNKSAEILVNNWIKKTENGMKCFILENGVDCKKFFPGEKGRKEMIVGFVGRTAEREEKEIKGFDLVKYACDIAGVKLKVASNLPDCRVDFEEMPEFYRSIDVLLLPSNSEGCSNTINEALASGVPVITTHIGFHGDLNVEGIIYVNREIKSIVDALKLISDSVLREDLSLKARKWAEEYSWEKVNKKYSEVFWKMIEQAKRNKTGKLEKDFVFSK